MWEFWGKKRFFFTVFNMGDPPTINVPKVLKCKINHIFFSSHKHVIPKYLRRTPQSKVMADIPFLGNRPLYFTLYKVEGCVTTLRSKVSAKLKK